MTQRRNAMICRAVLAAALIFYLFIAWAVPYSCTDDLQWGMEQGVRWWKYGLLNGRYAGNLCAVLMCHFPLVKVLLMGGGMFAIPVLMAALMARGDRERFLPMFLTANGMILLMPPVMWTEVYGWVSGFGNYGMSAAVFLAFLLLVRRAHQKKDRPKARAALLLGWALVMGLFVETLSLLFVGVTLVLGLYSIWDRALRLPYWAGFAGAVLAAVLVFSNGVLADLLGQGSALQGLRNLSFPPGSGPLTAGTCILQWYFRKLLSIAFLRGVHMAFPMAVIIALGFWNSRLRPLAVLGLVPAGAFFLIWSTEDYATWSHAAAGCLCWGLVFLALAAVKCEPELKIRRLLLFLAAPLALLPLAATTTLGQRFYFLPTLILIMLAMDLAAPLLTARAGTWAAGLAAAGLMLLWGYRGAVTASCTLARSAEISRVLEAREDRLILPTDRYYRIFWVDRNPWNVEYASYFRQFYGIAEDVTLIFLPGGSDETWPDYTPEQWENRLEFAPSDDFVSSLPQ